MGYLRVRQQIGGFDQQRHALATADAGGGDAIAQVAVAQLPSQGMHQAQAGGGQGVTKGDGAAMNVELVHFELQRLGYCQNLSRLCLVDLEAIDLLQAQATALKQQLDGRCRPDAHGPRWHANGRGHQQAC